MAVALNKLHSLFVEQSNVNGSILTVHYVVKNSPFKIDLQMDPSAVEGLKLRLYTHDTDCEVKLAKTEPLSFRVMPTPTGRSLVTVEVRIHVLSSSIEGSLFVIAIEKDGTRVDTQPVKVVSKLEQVRAAIKRAGGGNTEETSASDDDMTVDESFAAPNLKKRKVPLSDQVLHELEAIKKQQQQQFNLLSTLAKMHSSVDLAEMKEEDPSFSRPSKRRKMSEEIPVVTTTIVHPMPSFEQAMGTFLSAFAALPVEERQTRMACFLSQSPESANTASEIVSVISQTGADSSKGPCSCANCPYRTQMNALFTQLFPVEESQSESTSPDFHTSAGFEPFPASGIHA